MAEIDIFHLQLKKKKRLGETSSETAAVAKPYAQKKDRKDVETFLKKSRSKNNLLLAVFFVERFGFCIIKFLHKYRKKIFIKFCSALKKYATTDAMILTIMKN